MKTIYWLEFTSNKDKHRHSLFYLDNALSYGNSTSQRLREQSLQDAPASLQVRQENKITKHKYIYNWVYIKLKETTKQASYLTTCVHFASSFHDGEIGMGY